MDHFQTACGRCRQVWKKVRYYRDFRIRVQIWSKKVAFCGVPDHSHTFQSAPIVKYTKNGPLSEARWSVSTSLKNGQIPCGLSDMWVDLVNPAGPLGRVSQRPTAPTVGGTRIRHVVQMNRLGVCSRMVMKFFSETQNAQILADILKSSPDACHLASLTFS